MTWKEWWKLSSAGTLLHQDCVNVIYQNSSLWNLLIHNTWKFLSSEKHFDLRGALYSQHLRLGQRSDTVLTDIKVHFPARFFSLKWERVSRADSHSWLLSGCQYFLSGVICQSVLDPYSLFETESIVNIVTQNSSISLKGWNAEWLNEQSMDVDKQMCFQQI